MVALLVRDAMTPSVFAVGPDTSLETVARLLSARHISGAPVVDDEGRPLGVVTLTDLCDPDRDRTSQSGIAHYYRVDGRGAHPLGENMETSDGVVSDVMSPYVLAVAPDASLLDAVRLMVAEHVHRVLVVDDGKLVGIATSMDVLKVISRWAEKELDEVRSRATGG